MHLPILKVRFVMLSYKGELAVEVSGKKMMAILPVGTKNVTAKRCGSAKLNSSLWLDQPMILLLSLGNKLNLLQVLLKPCLKDL